MGVNWFLSFVEKKLQCKQNTKTLPAQLSVNHPETKKFRPSHFSQNV